MSYQNCPPNNPIEGIADAIGVASELYCKNEAFPTGKGKDRKVAVLFVVQPDEGNVFDQRHLEFRVFGRHSLPVVRATLAEVETEAALDEGSRRLVFRNFEISVVYFRAGYAPTDYHGDTEWAARLKIERSAAVKCPTAAYQCVGAKKIQQARVPRLTANCDFPACLGISPALCEPRDLEDNSRAFPCGLFPCFLLWIIPVISFGPFPWASTLPLHSNAHLIPLKYRFECDIDYFV